jgi:hypothetical protein
MSRYLRYLDIFVLKKKCVGYARSLGSLLAVHDGGVGLLGVGYMRPYTTTYVSSCYSLSVRVFARRKLDSFQQTPRRLDTVV